MHNLFYSSTSSSIAPIKIVPINVTHCSVLILLLSRFISIFDALHALNNVCAPKNVNLLSYNDNNFKLVVLGDLGSLISTPSCNSTSSISTMSSCSGSGSGSCCILTLSLFSAAIVFVFAYCFQLRFQRIFLQNHHPIDYHQMNILKIYNE